MSAYKRFLVFFASTYYPSGGEGDVVGSFDTLDEAKAHIEASDEDCGVWEVLDFDAREFVLQKSV